MSTPVNDARRPLRRDAEDRRSDAELFEHYQLEKKLAQRLRLSTKVERKTLYREVYNELYSSLPHHPRHTRFHSDEEDQRHVENQLRLLEAFLTPSSVFLEIGAGNAALSRAVSTRARRAIGLEVSVAAGVAANRTPNMTVVLFDGLEMPFKQKSITLAFSSAVMEHLHPEDAFSQLQQIASSLVEGGRYVLYTPHRFMGPGDISKYFDRVATGFHLKEYTFRELRALLLKAGFSDVKALVWFKGRYRQVSMQLLIANELFLQLLPYRIRHRLSWSFPIQRLVQIRLVAVK